MCLIFVACTFYETHLYIEGFSATQTIAKQTKQISRKCQLFLNEVHTSQSSALLVVSFFTFVFVAEIGIFFVEFFFTLKLRYSIERNIFVYEEETN